MKQLFQDLNTGQILSPELPRPAVPANHILIRSVCSLVSPGTERMLLEFGKAGWLSKARQQPDKVREVLQKIQTDGIAPTVKAVFNKLNQPLPLGYSNVGVIEEVGAQIVSFRKGMRVLSNGPHAELALVPAALCSAIPEEVSDEDAVFGILAAIALQGNRLLKPELGETVAVIGLGILGLISVQLLRANGCQVLAFDPNPARVALATELGANAHVLEEGSNPLKVALDFTKSAGVDGVLICAATTSNQPIQIAPQICRKRGRVILIGVVGLELSRKDFYDKEISFQVSCSYGPGRYDDLFEKRGLDYPIGFVRWTEERNIAAVLELLRDKRLCLSKYISKRIPFDEATAQYAELVQDSGQLGILFKYQGSENSPRLLTRRIELNSRRPLPESLGVGFIGAGNHARVALAPAFRKAKVDFRGACSSSGSSSHKLAKDFGFGFNTTSSDEIFSDGDCELVVISTRHDSHAELVAKGLASGKHIFVEKPLAVSLEQLQTVQNALESAEDRLLAVGFNRRFAPATKAIIDKLKGRRAPIAVVMCINAGAIAADNWNNDIAQGGGRIIGEACHFVDLAHALVQSPIEKVFCQPLFLTEDRTLNNALISLEFLDGSVASIQYLCNGNKTLSKENIKVFSSGNIFEIDNFSRVKGLGLGQKVKNSLKAQDKGHSACVAAFVSDIRSGSSANFSNQTTLHVSLACLAVLESARRERAVSMEELSGEFSQQQAEFYELARMAHHGS